MRDNHHNQRSDHMEEWGDIDSFCNEYGFYHHQQQQKTQFQEAQDECMEPSSSQDPPNPVENVVPRSTEGAGELKKIGKRCRKLSTEEILKLAGERFLQSSSQKLININVPMHPCTSSLSTGLSLSDKQDVHLAQLLLAAADMVGNQQLDRAAALLSNCRSISSNVGTPVQRAVFYFAEALTERINKEKSSTKQQSTKNYDACSKPNILAHLALHQELPLFQIVHFTAAQTIFENVGNNSKVHLIDFQIRTGLHWSTFIHAMSEQTRDRAASLRITAVETADKSEAERAGKLLQSFADHLNLPFSYNVVFCSDMRDLRQEDFRLDPQETVAILFDFVLRALISKPLWLKRLMNLTREMNPAMTVVCEVEANHNSPSFGSRFIEALFYYGALFEGVAESIGGGDGGSREAVEAGTYGEGIRNMVACEGRERVTRSVPMGVWRAFFARYGMAEVELSAAAVYEAGLIMKQSVCGRSCSLDVSTKCLLVGWKGMPLFSVSAWRFCSES